MFKATSSLAQEVSSMSSVDQPNQFKPQKVWPPDFSKLNEKQQFRFEHKYRRRAKLKYTRPSWDRGVKVTAWVACTCNVILSHYRGEIVTHLIIIAMLVYGVLFMDGGTQETPFEGVSRALIPIASTTYSFIRFELGFVNRQTRFGRQAQQRQARQPPRYLT